MSCRIMITVSGSAAILLSVVLTVLLFEPVPAQCQPLKPLLLESSPLRSVSDTDEGLREVECMIVCLPNQDSGKTEWTMPMRGLPVMSLLVVGLLVMDVDEKWIEEEYYTILFLQDMD